jgi:tetratricopeptide (TPR) repeat protein
VDSETYPVADNLALAWHVGVGSRAANERWAFAFSAKAEWQSKVKTDIAKIVATRRGYTKAFFVTNQAVRDKKRAEIEDDLRNTHGIDIRILDRTWILDRVFTGRHEDLAVAELNLTALKRRDVRKGPLDVRRERDLEDLDTQIRDSLQAGNLGSALVDNSLEAANVARDLERPRSEVEGRYARADKLANKYGSLHQQIETAYQWAWTLYFWYEDYDAFVDQYSIVESRVDGSQNAYDLERLTALWHCLFSGVRHTAFNSESTSFRLHTDKLTAELERLSGETDRPSTSLQAETLLLQVRLICRFQSDEPFDDVLQALNAVILRSKGLVGYPLAPLIETLAEIGHALEGTPAYDTLFETIVEVSSKRDGEVAAARLLLKRGECQLKLGHPVEAIATLGQVLAPLYKHETRQEVVRALYLCGCAYDDIGLLWAARGTLLSAASIATNDLWQYEDITFAQATCYRKVKWIELRLGRLPHQLAWHETDKAIRQYLANQGYDQKALFSDESSFELFIGRLLLRTKFTDLNVLQSIPSCLDRMGLDRAADALLYALGYEERLTTLAVENNLQPEELARKWYGIESDVPLPEYPALYNQATAELQSKVLGCKVNVTCDVEAPCIEVAESFLASLESFLATSLIKRAMAIEPELGVEVHVLSEKTGHKKASC